MPIFQILLHTSDISMVLGENPTPCIGFYTSRRAKAESAEEAFQQIMKDFDADPEMRDIFQTAHAQGLRPRTEIEEVYLIPGWKALLPWKPPGLCFYPAEAEKGEERKNSSCPPANALKRVTEYRRSSQPR